MNRYKEIGNQTVLSVTAKERILLDLLATIDDRGAAAEQTPRRKSVFSHTFKAAAACAAAVLVCGTALGTGLYFGLGGSGNNGDIPNMIYTPEYLCYDMDYELELGEYDIDNVEMTLSYAFNEPDVRKRYDEVLKEAQEKGYGEVLKYEIILGAYNTNYKHYSHDLAIIRRFEIKNIDEFPFEDYMLNVVEEDGEIVERTYTHIEKIVIPQELFVDCVNPDGTDRINRVHVYFYERIEYEIGISDYVPKYEQDGSLHKDSWSDGGKVYNDWGLSSFTDFEIAHVDKYIYFYYNLLECSKIEIYEKSVSKTLTAFKSKETHNYVGSICQ